MFSNSVKICVICKRMAKKEFAETGCSSLTKQGKLNMRRFARFGTACTVLEM